MAQDIEKAANAILTEIFGPTIRTPDWLQRPGRHECRDQWPLVQQMYQAITGCVLPDTMPSRERRRVDGVFHGHSDRPFIFELDETQHFNMYRAATLRLYPNTLQLGFSKDNFIQHCRQKKKLEGGGFAKPKPPLFPDTNGRHQQRAFRDALTDLLPQEHGFAPTLRLADFEIHDWIHTSEAIDHMVQLIKTRLGEMHLKFNNIKTVTRSRSTKG